MKGFILFDDSKHTVEDNILTFRNSISPYANISVINNNNLSGRRYVDENYGLVYDDFYLTGRTFIYGPESSIPKYSGDSLSNYGFLRVPFRKIPRIWVDNRDALMSVISSIESNDPNLLLLYRGQFTEYTIERDKETLLNLYGDENAIEPSLVSSAARKNMHLEDILPSWMAIINLYLSNIFFSLSSEEKNELYRDLNNFQSSSNFNLFALALAQHYGLPSVGLDVTPDIDVALFFSLNKFSKTANPFHYEYKDIKEVSPDKPPVIYIMAPTEDHQLNYSQFRPSIFPFVRPDAQKAHFMHTGWGLQKNFAATRIFLALYLNPTGDFGQISSASNLFPVNDSFALLIDSIRESSLGKDSILSSFLESFYYISV